MEAQHGRCVPRPRPSDRVRALPQVDLRPGLRTQTALNSGKRNAEGGSHWDWPRKGAEGCREDKSHEGAFKLVLRDVKNGSERELFDGGRWCELLWQKDDSRVAITDWAGSSLSRILVLDANG